MPFAGEILQKKGGGNGFIYNKKLPSVAVFNLITSSFTGGNTTFPPG